MRGGGLLGSAETGPGDRPTASPGSPSGAMGSRPPGHCPFCPPRVFFSVSLSFFSLSFFSFFFLGRVCVCGVVLFFKLSSSIPLSPGNQEPGEPQVSAAAAALLPRPHNAHGSTSTEAAAGARRAAQSSGAATCTLAPRAEACALAAALVPAAKEDGSLFPHSHHRRGYLPRHGDFPIPVPFGGRGHSWGIRPWASAQGFSRPGEGREAPTGAAVAL